MEPIIKLGDEKDKLYNGLLNKYLHYSFNTPEEETEFLTVLKNLLNDNEIQFEYKITLLNGLTAGVTLKNFGIHYPPSASK